MTAGAADALSGDPTPRWGTRDRDVKARQILATVTHFWRGPTRLADTQWCDVGCGNGVIAASLAPHVQRIHGLDPEPWPGWSELMRRHPNLELREASVTGDPLPPASVDVVVCNQVYEHADDARALIAGIHRLLRPGGLCYFAGPNLLFPVEPHVFWPFVHWLPRAWATRLLRAAGVTEPLDAHSQHYWTLRRWLANFEVENALPYVLGQPRAVGRTSWLARLASVVPAPVVRWATPLSPGFIFVLRKRA